MDSRTSNSQHPSLSAVGGNNVVIQPPLPNQIQQQQQKNLSLLPFNPANSLLTETDLYALLNSYGGEGAKVNDINTFRKAFTHRSYCTRKNDNFVEGNAECPRDCLPLQEESGERLEFLGDAVLNLVVADYLFQRYPGENEGFLTKMRSKLVNGEMLKDLCLIAGLDVHVCVSKQIEEAGGRRAKNVLEDCFEAFLGAMFVDAGKDARGYKTVYEWMVEFLETNVDFVDLVAQHSSFKDMLTKYFQYTFNSVPRFDVEEEEEEEGEEEEGEETIEKEEESNEKEERDEKSKTKTVVSSSLYTSCVRTREGLVVGTGTGSTKKNAENEAARKAIVYYGRLRP